MYSLSKRVQGAQRRPSTSGSCSRKLLVLSTGDGLNCTLGKSTAERRNPLCVQSGKQGFAAVLRVYARLAPWASMESS